VSITSVLEGLGTALPPRRLTNEEMARGLDTDDEWIRTRTGITARHVAEDDVATGDLAVDAGAAALKSAGGGTVDAVVVATTTPDQLCPNTASGVAERLGFTGAAAIDLNVACTGFVYGLATAAGLLATATSERLLLIGAETMVRFTNPYDRTTRVLFGDGAGAVALRAGRADEPGAVGAFDLGSDGSLGSLLEIPGGGSRRPPSHSDYTYEDSFLRMEGREVYRHAVHRMIASLTAACERSGLAVTDLDRVVAHQANARILEAVAGRLGMPVSKFPMTVAEHGNTSAASIPLALAAEPPTPGERVGLVAFGGGFAWGAATLVWPQLSQG
jgi:3-oxoacyl-[acyl-carrier-protein] synthase-3